MEPNYREKMATMSQLIEQIGSWSQNNFQDKQAPALGMLEEVGEACHGILKNIQRIRGFDKTAKFQKHLYDSFADAMIYACNLAYNHGAFFAFKRNQKTATVRDEKLADYFVLSHLLQALAALMNQEGREMDKSIEVDIYNSMLQRFCYIMEVWAAQYGIDLEEATHATWREIVLKRDWVKDTSEGGGHKH